MTTGARASGRRRVRAWCWVGLAVVVLLVAAGVVLALSAREALQQARAVEASSASAVELASAGNLTAAVESLADVEESSAGLAATLGGPLWGVAARLPVVGAWVTAARTLASSAETVSASAGVVAREAAPLVEARGRTPDGALDLAGVERLGPALQALSVDTAAALAELDAIDTASLPDQLATAVTEARDRLADVPGAAATAAETVALLPGMLGSDGPRRWAVVLQNLSEARGTGGIIGSYVLLTADAGRISVETADGNNAITSTPVPQDAMPVEFRELWGVDTTEWSSFNMSLHYPYAARLAADGLAARGVEVDGVAMLDQQAVAALLTGTGPVAAEGITITAADAESFLTTGAYARFPDTAQRDAVVNALLRATLEKALTESVDVLALARAMSSPVSEGRVLLWSDRADEQEWLASRPVGGSLPSTPGPFAAAAFNNGAGNKMDAYVSATLDYAAGSCPSDPQQSSTIRITLRNNAPDVLPDYVTGRLDDPAADEFSTKMLVHVYGPVGAELVEATLDGESQYVREGEERGHPVWRYDVTLERGQSRELALSLLEPTVEGVTPVVVAQPMSIDMVATASETPCG